MGCDIHPTIEWLQYPGDDRYPDHWSPLSYQPMNWSRHYSLFVRMAGVRCYECDYGKCIHVLVAPRGFPEGTEAGTYEMQDMHTPSWLSLAELKKAVSFVDPAPDVKATIAAMEKFEELGFKTRLVFAFDN